MVPSSLQRKCAAMQDNDESKGANKDQNGTIVGLFGCEIWPPSFKGEHCGKQ